jgi:hypothetical protein
MEKANSEKITGLANKTNLVHKTQVIQIIALFT